MFGELQSFTSRVTYFRKKILHVRRQCVPWLLFSPSPPVTLFLMGESLLARYPTLASAPGPLFYIYGIERAWCAKIRHVTSFWTSVSVSMETPPFTMTSSFQSVYGQVVAWCEYSSSETDGRIAS